MSSPSVAYVLTKCAFTGTWAVGMCGQFCAAMYGYDASGYVDAVAQWNKIPSSLKHPGSTSAPAGALIFWGGGSAGHGHVAIADGFGSVWSIDISGAGTVSRVTTGTITSRWGLPLLGWSAPYFQGEEWSPDMIYGVDVSAYQPINFALTTPSDNHPVSFAFIKATEGMTVSNSLLAGQTMWARDHDLAVGFYHFARPGSMVDQCDRFLSKLDLQPGDMLMFDWEDAGVSGAQKDAALAYLQGRAPGHRVLLYCNKDFWINRDTTSFAADGLWIATGGLPAGSPGIQAPWKIHQYSTAGDIDHDIAAFATKADMIDWAGGDVALTADDKAWILANVPKAVLTTDGILKSPADASDHDTNPFWTLASYITDTGARVRSATSATGALAAILAQAQANGSALSAIKLILDDLDLSNVPAEVAAKIESLKLIVTVQEGS